MKLTVPCCVGNLASNLSPTPSTVYRQTGEEGEATKLEPKWEDSLLCRY